MAVNTYQIGDIIVLRCEFRVDGVLTDPTSAECRVKLPDGTIATPALSSGGTGIRTAQYPPTQNGYHYVAWQSTGAAAGYEESRFYVKPRDVG